MTSHQRWINAKRDSSSTRVQEGRGGSPVPRPSLSSMTLLNIEPLSINTQTQSGPALPRSSPRGPRPGCALHITDYPSNLSLPVLEDSPPPPRHKKKKEFTGTRRAGAPAVTSQPSLIPHVPLIKLFLPSGSSGVVIKREAKAEASLEGWGGYTRGARPPIATISQKMMPFPMWRRFNRSN